MTAYPLLLEPILKPRVWGGRSLAAFGKTLPEGVAVGESWEVADLPDAIEDGRNVITNGAFAGRTLREVISDDDDALLGSVSRSPEGGFPLLIKYLDARENLSVQVHPTPAYVASHPDTHVKNEAWMVMEAAPGAVIYRGVRAGVTPESFRAHIVDGTVADDLNAVPARVGDVHELPSGTVHALGAGIVVAEVQTPSDTTFRVHDWGRPREVHVDAALACIDFAPPRGEVAPSSRPIETQRLRTTLLVDSDSFSIERIEAVGSEADLSVITDDMPIVWMVTAGAGMVRGGGCEVALRRGTTVLMPAALSDGEARLDAGTQVLRVAPPLPIRGAIA